MSMHVKNFGDYSVKNIKTFMGMEGHGFNANLYRGKKKVAFCIDDARGGEVDIDWVEGGWKGEEAMLLEAHLKTLPPVVSKFGSKKMKLTISAGWFVNDCVTRVEMEKDVKKMRKQCQTKTLFRTKDQGFGRYSIFDTPLNDKIREHIFSKYGNDTEIFNDVFASGGVPSVLQPDKDGD